LGYIEDIRKLVGHRPLILVGAVVVMVDEHGRILLQQRKFPKGSWGLPGGLMELGESTEDVARREVFEETRLTVEDLKLINVYSGPSQYIKAENGDEFFAVTVAYYTENFSGTLVVDQVELNDCQFIDPLELPEGIVKSHRKVVMDYLALTNKQ
jgi:8-oxo-dGTP pyrophosphatase MutT (NUDIX family)